MVKLRQDFVGIMVVVMTILYSCDITHTHTEDEERRRLRVHAPRRTAAVNKHPQDGDVLSKITRQHSLAFCLYMPHLCRSTTSPPGPDVSREVIIGTTCKDGTLDP